MITGWRGNCIVARAARQRGQAMVEYLIILPALLLLVLGAIQFALIYQAKFTLNYATFMAARQGALKNAKMTSIKDGLAAGMTPLFMRTTDAPFLDDLAKARIIAMIEVFNPLTAKVEIISPTKAAFDALQQDNQIPNDNLMYRSAAGDGMSIQDANLLKIRVTYCVRLIVPFVNRVIYALSNGIAGVTNLTNESYWTSATATTTNQCSEISDKYADLMHQFDSVTAAMPETTIGSDLSSVGKSIGDLLNNIPTTIPLLNWNVGGMRIPITAEAIVRMQSPIAGDSLP
jgi:TadE-like protein